MRRASLVCKRRSLVCAEALEVRRLLTDFPVLNTSDTGADSLRAAITNANNNPGTDTISFNIPGSGVHTINVASTMQIKEAVTINGYTQGGASANALATSDNAKILIELNGAAAPGSCLFITGTQVTIRGLCINSFGQEGIIIQESDC